MGPRRARHAEVLIPAGAALQELAEEQCGESLFRSVLRSLAALCPIYGALQLQAEQAQLAFFICKATLPASKPHEALKASADSVFSPRNLAAIEALCALCGGSGEGLANVWRLVVAALVAVDEYVPQRDGDNHYVAQRAAWHVDVAHVAAGERGVRDRGGADDGAAGRGEAVLACSA